MRRKFLKEVMAIALPVAVQSLVQSSFSVVDQVMIGQLGAAAISAIGFGGKFLSLPLMVIAGGASAAGILTAQYEGQNNRLALERSFFQVLMISLGVSSLFLGAAAVLPGMIMGWYSPDPQVVALASGYLRIFAWSLPFSTLTSLYSVVLRCCGFAMSPLYASGTGILANTVLNALFIFGLGWGVQGAALASLISQVLMAGLTFLYIKQNLPWFHPVPAGAGLKTVTVILLPLVMTEFLWSLGENVYSMVYGHLGTAQAAAMTMTVPLQSMTMGLLSGFSQAAGILIGRRLGTGDRQGAWEDSLSLIRYSLAGSLVLAGLLALTASLYVKLYSVDRTVREMCVQLILVFALFSVVKTQNMVLGGGVLRSGGKTAWLLMIDTLGTWGMGVPAAILAGQAGLPVAAVYALLSLEEVLRLVITAAVFVSRKWMKTIQARAV